MSGKHIRVCITVGAMHGVMVRVSFFPSKHLPLMPECGLSWGLNFRALVCGNFWSLSSGFSLVLWFPPLLHQLMVQQ